MADDRCEYCQVPESLALVAHEVVHIIGYSPQLIQRRQLYGIAAARCCHLSECSQKFYVLHHLDFVLGTEGENSRRVEVSVESTDDRDSPCDRRFNDSLILRVAYDAR
jgi:hypothetical protein